MDGRFATCCCALIRRDGSVRIANAGHLSPYCDGKELETPGGLPLGLVPGVEYAEVRLSVKPGQRMVFLSDGVVEARSKSGELYGFERTRTISIEPIKDIAATAQRFGQEDDITVVGIEAEPVLV
jgi:phosphoserine phosphatase RsbU/P